MINLTGVFTALITPFDPSGFVDLRGLRDNVAFQLKNQIKGLVVLGTSGEAATLTDQEKVSVIKAVKEEAKGEALIIVGTGSNSTAQAIKNTRLAKEMGADAALIVAPYYNKPTQEGLYRHFRTIAETVALPILLYNHPGRCGTILSIDALRRLAVVPNIIGVKEVTDSVDRISSLVGSMSQEFPDFNILSGDDQATLTLMANGGHGLVSVASNLIPNEMKSLVDYCLQGNFIKAKEQHHAILPLFHVLTTESNPIPIKAAMQWKGFAAGPCRLPLCELKPDSRLKLETVMQTLFSPAHSLAGSYG